MTIRIIRHEPLGVRKPAVQAAVDKAHEEHHAVEEIRHEAVRKYEHKKKEKAAAIINMIIWANLYAVAFHFALKLKGW